MSDDAAKLRAKAPLFPEMGAFLATLRIPDDGPVRWGRPRSGETITRSGAPRPTSSAVSNRWSPRRRSKLNTLAMFYELWDVRSGNLINTYDSESEALAVVRELLAANGSAYASALSLAFEDDEERTTLVARGLDLAERAEQARTAPITGQPPAAPRAQRPPIRPAATG